MYRKVVPILKKLKFFDSSLRDGSHAVKQQLYKEHITEYCKAMDDSGVYTIIVGHGNGLGASSIQMGYSAMDEIEMIKVAHDNLEKTRLGTFVTVGFGTIKDHIMPAIEIGTQVFCIATHCTEADTMKPHVKYLSRHGKEVYGVLMNCHLVTEEKLLEQVKFIESYGANGVILMDSAGTLTPKKVQKLVTALYEKIHMEIGFHAHNNLSMAVANSYTALNAGASIIDGTILGFGAGAGNCQIDALIALLQKEGIETGVNLYQILDAGKNVIQNRLGYQKGIEGTCVISGYAGVVSTFKSRTEYIANKYKLDPRDIFIELGKRKAIAGQDDLILEIAENLVTRRNS